MLSGSFVGEANGDGVVDGSATPGAYRVRVVCDTGRVLVELGDLRRSVACSAAPVGLRACVSKRPLTFSIERVDRGRQQVPYAVAIERVGDC